MRTITEALQSIAITLWVGGLWVIGLIVAPALFHALSDRSQAGLLAGHFFAVIGYIGLGCGAYLLLFRLARFGGGVFGQLFFWAVLLMAALAAAGQFGLQPMMASLKQQALPAEVMQSIFRDRFAAWHGVSSIFYLIECFLGLIMVLQHGRGR
ncbi:MAG TPA: DUF4149 domain-containing protein [Burkholderiales bacterium]|nr:DUF4149 domain-containing protein [Burkholderiales bacterium]